MMGKEDRDKFGCDKDGRSKLDKKNRFYYDVNDEGIEYLIAHATIKDLGDDWILTKEWRHRQERGDFFPDAKPGQRWNISYRGNTPWTGIKGAVKKTISAITPVWNFANLTAQFLFGNNIHYPDDPSVQWIIIDNGSTDATEGILQYWKDIIGDRLIVLKNETNQGFSVACNQGAARADGGTLLFLNNDVLIKGDYVTPLEKALADNPKSLVGPQLANFDTGWNVFGGQLISYLVGWCLAMNKETFDTLGGFDERFSPAYYEDIDLCYNAHRSGYELQQVWVPLQHLGEQSSGQLKDKRGITEASRVKFAKKWGLEL